MTTMSEQRRGVGTEPRLRHRRRPSPSSSPRRTFIDAFLASSSISALLLLLLLSSPAGIANHRWGFVSGASVEGTGGGGGGGGGGDGGECSASETNDDGTFSDSSSSSSSSVPPKMYNPPSCRLFLAESTLGGPNAGLGMFVARPVPRGGPVAPSDVVIQIVDVPPTASGLKFLLHEYLWDGQETGGQFEGKTVYSASPGVGMLANGHRDLHNVLPYRAEVDEADLPRTTSPGAGASTHYHNYTYFARRQIPAGGEILVNMGTEWFEEREKSGKIPPPDPNDSAEKYARDVGWLRENGMCLDNLRAGRSERKDAGRGAFAARYLPEGSVVTPVPVAPIANGRDALKIVRIKSSSGAGGASGDEDDGDEEVEITSQLLTNYCYGHVNSSLLLFPYSPVINLVNHGGPKRSNAKLRWSKSTQHRGRDWPSTLSLSQLLERDSPSGLMLELVATADIRPGDEVLIDYGPRWREAWNAHVASWRPVPGAESYTPSYVMDDVAGRVRTEEEQRTFPYGDNVVTACFYRYSDNRAEAEKIAAAAALSSSSASGSGSARRAETTAFRWKLRRGIFDHSSLRPCSILARDDVQVNPDRTEQLYTVLIRNRYGLPAEERVPRGATHVVNGVPRQAIRFADKLYTTDMHLTNAFREAIGLPDGVFPEQWMDLA